METKILELKKLNAAYNAALEFDYCPGAGKFKSVKELGEFGLKDTELKDALNENQGCRPDEIAGSISSVIESL